MLSPDTPKVLQAAILGTLSAKHGDDYQECKDCLFHLCDGCDDEETESVARAYSKAYYALLNHR